MYRLLAKYGYRQFMEGDGVGTGGGDAPAAPAEPAAPAAAPEAPAAPAAGDPPAAPAKPQSALAAAAAAVKAAEAPKVDDWKEYVVDPAKTQEENDAAKAENDKAKPVEETAEAKAEREKAEKAKADDPAVKAEAAKALADGYKLDPPEGFELDKGVEAEFRAVAGEAGLSQEVVDKLKGVQIKLYEKQAEQHAAVVTKWGEDLKTDKELGGLDHDAKLGRAGFVLNEFFSPEIAKMMDTTGIGNHPEFVRGFYKIGLLMGEIPTFQNRPGMGGKEDIIDVLYPKS